MFPAIYFGLLAKLGGLGRKIVYWYISHRDFWRSLSLILASICLTVDILFSNHFQSINHRL